MSDTLRGQPQFHSCIHRSSTPAGGSLAVIPHYSVAPSRRSLHIFTSRFIVEKIKHSLWGPRAGGINTRPGTGEHTSKTRSCVSSAETGAEFLNV